MSYDNLGMIRRGWQDGAATVAPQVPGLADSLEQWLAEAVRLDRLDEATLLSIVDAATQLAADCGAVDVAPALSKRLRRHVYEYLLSLDAAGDTRSAMPAILDLPAEEHGPLIGADEVAALSRVQRRLGTAVISDSDGAAVDPFATGAPLAQEGIAARFEPAPASTLPQFSFHIGDPDDLLADRTPKGEIGHAAGRSHEGDSPSPGGRDLTTADPPTRRASFSDPSTWPKPVPPTLRGVRDALAGSPSPSRQLAPDTESEPAVAGGAGLQDLSSWEASRSAEPLPRSGFEDMARWSSPWPAAQPSTGERDGHAGLDLDPNQRIPGFGPAEAPSHRDLAESWRDASEGWGATHATNGSGVRTPEIVSGWSVRQPEAVELHLNARPGTDPAAPAVPSGEVSERDLAALRGSVEERLRKKRCDDAAAMLQQAAQELGGDAVAELALDAGDRCRTLGKRNAALNCYLAASRADPVYEPPLARLADICIDDQDIDLAVSYLERIARLTRLRGDTRGALRIYRKIATIAPYRDDVLEMLMRAQTTGRIDP